jgi:leader peptidase (prepilin peptidase)/N-methyltransferase
VNVAAKPGLDTIVTSGLGVTAFLLAVLTQPGTIEVIRAGLLIAISALLALTNLRTGIIPDRITLPALLVGLLTSPAAQFPGLWSALLGALVGGGIVFLIVLATRGGIGGGVLKMAAMIGAFLGWQLTILTLGLSFIASAAAAGSLRLLGRRPDSIEFAPYLAVGATISLLAGDRIIRWYVG